MKSEHFMAAILCGVIVLSIAAIGYKSDRDAKAALDTYAAQQEQLRLAKDKQVRDKLKMATPEEINRAIWEATQ